MAMVIGVCVAHVYGRSLLSFCFGAAVWRSKRVSDVAVSVSLHQVALCWGWTQHELHLLGSRLEEDLRVFVRVVHGAAVQAGLAWDWAPTYGGGS